MFTNDYAIILIFNNHESISEEFVNISSIAHFFIISSFMLWVFFVETINYATKAFAMHLLVVKLGFTT